MGKISLKCGLCGIKAKVHSRTKGGVIRVDTNNNPFHCNKRTAKYRREKEELQSESDPKAGEGD